MIDQFTAELEALGGHVHHGRDTLEELRGDGVSVTPCLALIADTGTAVVSARLSGGRRPGLVDPVHVIEAREDQLVPDLAPRWSGSAPSWHRRRPSRSSPAPAAPPTSSRP